MIALSKEELLSLLAAARARRERDWLMILVAFHHGLRVSELISIQPHDIRDGHLSVHRLKGSNHTTQVLIEHPDPLLDEVSGLNEYLRKSKNGEPIFPISRRQFGRIMETHGAAAGLPRHKCKPHVLKHTCAMLHISKAGIENVRAWLGHKSLSSTGEYLKVSDEEAGRAIIRSL